MKLYLVRHGQTPANVAKILDTALPGPELTELGREQARQLAGKLAAEPVRAVHASYATRAQQTAAPLAQALGLPVERVEGVHEIVVGDLEGRNDQAAVETYVSVVAQWTRGELDVAMPGGETGEQARKRFTTAVEGLAQRHAATRSEDVVVLVSHGGLMRLGAEWLAPNVRPELADQGLVPNTGVIELERRTDGGWRCLNWVGMPM
ncbi:histidine phosphatase family protein [Amycolatopsis endophytica]|uniref:Putative phosphoglycerate mutase n=1 Tax=Amycolatopsis endophytica TaxID=860233 RepID=A0A853B054_9PSEU|nr:histidine phosphatase family protein [Amycolatopsis endophytica]NYI88255.1 putative phosphoglycerate mutase [Amycolatopsis endophytica]